MPTLEWACVILREIGCRIRNDRDNEYVANKLDITTDELMGYFNAPNKTYIDTKNQKFIYDPGAKTLRAIGLEKGGKR